MDKGIWPQIDTANPVSECDRALVTVRSYMHLPCATGGDGVLVQKDEINDFITCKCHGFNGFLGFREAGHGSHQ
jgi:hypothetical protein